MTSSLGWPEAPLALQRASILGLRLCSHLVNGWMRLVPPRGSRLACEGSTPGDGAAFQFSSLGPPPLLEALNRSRWSGTQRRIGLTGGIASGKSSVGQLLVKRGLPLLDADVFAREALAPGTPATQAVLQRYGERVRAATAAISIDRAALGRIVFSDPEERRWLERLVHPLVRARLALDLAALTEAPAVVLVIPLLFEAGLEGLCSEIWLVDCEEAQQLQRLMHRDQLSQEEALARLAAQWPLARKRGLADVLIDNRGTPGVLAEQLDRALRSTG